MNASSMKAEAAKEMLSLSAFSSDARAAYDRIIASCRLYVRAMELSASGKAQSPSEAASSYGPSFASEAIGMRASKTGYWEACAKIASIGKWDFMQYTDSEISSVSAIVSASRAKPAVSSSSFDCAMYGFSSLGVYQSKELMKAHFMTIAKLAAYERECRGIDEGSVVVEYASGGSHPGREISFSVSGLSPYQAMRDMKEATEASGVELSVCEVRDGLARIVI
jgi:hypothetical protein